MTDIVDSKTRSRMMSGIRGKDTRPELVVRRFLHSKGFRYRLHDVKLSGRPDVVLPKYKLAIFVHGCFWHRHRGCKFLTNPDQNREKWNEKFRKNVERDKKQVEQLLSQGWRVLVIWECVIKSSTPDLQWLPATIQQGKFSYQEFPM